MKTLAFIRPDYIRSLCFQLICILPMAIACVLLYKPGEIVGRLGLHRKFIAGTGIAFVCTLPMIVGNLFIGSLRHDISFHIIIRNIVYAGFFEELAFRGFLFGLLFRYTKWGFIPASFIGGVFFGLAHMYQGHDILSALSAFAITAAGAVFFSWAYTEWNYNLWVSIGLHTFMNASWILLSVGDGAVGSIWSNIFRIITIFTVILLTILYKKKNRSPFIVNRYTLWVNKG